MPAVVLVTARQGPSISLDISIATCYSHHTEENPTISQNTKENCDNIRTDNCFIPKIRKDGFNDFKLIPNNLYNFMFRRKLEFCKHGQSEALH